MGASGWSYFVPYQRDLSAALQALRQEVFRGGEYTKPYVGTTEEFVRYLPKELAALREWMVAEYERRQRRLRRKVKTIDGLLKRAGEDGTHSILDVDRISDVPDFGAIVPLSGEQLLTIFGTEQPDHITVERVSQAGQLADLYGRWQGICLVVYEGEVPVEVYFEGASGD